MFYLSWKSIQNKKKNYNFFFFFCHSPTPLQRGGDIFIFSLMSSNTFHLEFFFIFTLTKSSGTTASTKTYKSNKNKNFPKQQSENYIQHIKHLQTKNQNLSQSERLRTQDYTT